MIQLRPDVTVIIPTYDRRSLLKEAVASCFKANDALTLEVVIVDDGSTDGTQAWAKSLDDDRITYLHQENQGAQAARNWGMEQAEGRYIKFLDSDDELLPGMLSEEVKELQEEKAAISCGHLLVQGSEQEFTFEQTPNPDFISGIFRGSVWTHSHVFLYRSSALQKCEWGPTIPYHQDTSFAIQAMTQGLSEVVVDQPVAVYRDHEGKSISNNRKSRASAVERAKLQVDLINRGIGRLREHGCLSDHHLKAAAEGMWQWAHIISAYDPTTFTAVYERIQSVLPTFSPNRQSSLLAVLDLLVGAQGTEYVTYPVRRAKQALR